MSASGQQPTTPPRRRCRSERGAALLETAITLPLLLFVCIGIIEFGRLYQTWQVMTNAAREGARIAVLPSPTNAGYDSRVRQYLDMGGLNNDSTVGVNVAPVNVDLGAGGTASGSRVTVTRDPDALAPAPSDTGTAVVLTPTEGSELRPPICRY